MQFWHEEIFFFYILTQSNGFALLESYLNLGCISIFKLFQQQHFTAGFLVWGIGHLEAFSFTLDLKG